MPGTLHEDLSMFHCFWRHNFVKKCCYATLQRTYFCFSMATVAMWKRHHVKFYEHYPSFFRSQWPRSLRRRSAAARLLRSWVRNPPGAWMFVCCECCVLSGRVLCDELIIRLEESYRLRCVVVCDLETSKMRRPWPALGRSATGKKSIIFKSS